MPVPVLPAAVSPALLQATEGGGPNVIIMLLVPLLIFVFVAILPERKERKRKAQMLSELKKNDKVLTTSGLFATVAAVSDNDLTLKFDDGPTRVRVLKTAIASVVNQGADEAGKPAG